MIRLVGVHAQLTIMRIQEVNYVCRYVLLYLTYTLTQIQKNAKLGVQVPSSLITQQ